MSSSICCDRLAAGTREAPLTAIVIPDRSDGRHAKLQEGQLGHTCTGESICSSIVGGWQVLEAPCSKRRWVGDENENKGPLDRRFDFWPCGAGSWRAGMGDPGPWLGLFQREFGQGTPGVRSGRHVQVPIPFALASKRALVAGTKLQLAPTLSVRAPRDSSGRLHRQMCRLLVTSRCELHHVRTRPLLPVPESIFPSTA